MIFSRPKVEHADVPEFKAAADRLTATVQAANERYQKRTEELEAKLAAIEEPADIFRITKDFTTGRFIVSMWSKGIVDEHLMPGHDFRRVEARYVNLETNLPSHKAAEAWLKAFLDPTTNRTGYDANGKRIEARP